MHHPHSADLEALEDPGAACGVVATRAARTALWHTTLPLLCRERWGKVGAASRQPHKESSSSSRGPPARRELFRTATAVRGLRPAALAARSSQRLVKTEGFSGMSHVFPGASAQCLLP